MKNQILHIYLLSLAFGMLSLAGIAQNGPVAYYPFNGNAQDESGNSHHGIIHGDPQLIEDRNGVPNSAYKFDGVDDYIQVPYHSDLQPTTAMTLSLWAYRDDWEGIDFYAGLAGNTESGGYELYIYYDYYYEAQLWGYVRRNGYYEHLKENLSGFAPGWHHFAITHESQNYSTSLSTMYVDGVEVDDDVEYCNCPVEYAHQNSFMIGAEAGPGDVPEGDYWDGAIDEVAVYDRALSADEIMQLYIGPGSGATHVLQLPKGWSGISSYVIPDNASLEFVLAPIQDGLIILKNFEGSYWPITGLNTIGDWDDHKGYIVKMQTAKQVTFSGTMQDNLTLNLLEGWNLLPVLNACENDAEDLFSQIIGNLLIVKEVAETGIYWPQFGINTLGTIQPGKAYFVLVDADVDLEFPDCTK